MNRKLHRALVRLIRHHWDGVMTPCEPVCRPQIRGMVERGNALLVDLVRHAWNRGSADNLYEFKENLLKLWEKVEPRCSPNANRVYRRAYQDLKGFTLADWQSDIETGWIDLHVPSSQIQGHTVGPWAIQVYVKDLWAANPNYLINYRYRISSRYRPAVTGFVHPLVPWPTPGVLHGEAGQEIVNLLPEDPAGAIQKVYQALLDPRSWRGYDASRYAATPCSICQATELTHRRTRIDICQACGKIFCTHCAELCPDCFPQCTRCGHLTYCEGHYQLDGESYCQNCRPACPVCLATEPTQVCDDCYVAVCEACLVQCQICHSTRCPRCLETCKCGTQYCRHCPSLCFECNTRGCRQCHAEDTATGAMVCPDCMHACPQCGRQVRIRLLRSCRDCSRSGCCHCLPVGSHGECNDCRERRAHVA